MGVRRGNTRSRAAPIRKQERPSRSASCSTKNQDRYRFTLPDAVRGGPPGTRAVDFIETPPERVRITWKGNCFEAEGGGHEGRVWFDPETFDILQVEVRLSKPFLVPMRPGYIGLLRPSEWNGLKARCASLV